MTPPRPVDLWVDEVGARREIPRVLHGPLRRLLHAGADAVQAVHVQDPAQFECFDDRHGHPLPEARIEGAGRVAAHEMPLELRRRRSRRCREKEGKAA